MATAIARHVGARFVVVSDLSPFRLELAHKAGADLVLDPTRTSLREAMDDLGMVEAVRAYTHDIATRTSLKITVHAGDFNDRLDPTSELVLYRVVQEALTNVRKHAGQVKRVAVNVVYEPHAVSVQITDDGRGASVAMNEGGHGLIGMRERMALCGGTVSAAPRQGGGWQVRASAPLADDSSVPVTDPCIARMQS